MNDKDKKKRDYENEREEYVNELMNWKGQKMDCFWTENRIKNHASFLNLIIESLPNPFYVVDTSDYTIKIANSASQFDQFLKGSTCYALIHKNDQPCNSAEHPCPIETIRKTKKPRVHSHLGACFCLPAIKPQQVLKHYVPSAAKQRASKEKHDLGGFALPEDAGRF